MADLVLKVETRAENGKSSARANRRDGLTPAILYGGSLKPVSVALETREVQKALNAGQILSKMITIQHKKEKQPVIVRDIQFHPVTDKPLHLDLFRVETDTVIAVEVPVRFLNEEASPGLKRGGALNIVRHTIELNVPAGHIPEAIEVDLTDLEIGDNIHISDISLPEGAHVTVQDRDFTIATIAGARAALSVEDEAAEGEEGEEASSEQAED